LAAHGVSAAPAGLSAVVAKAAIPAASVTAATATSHALAKGALLAMKMSTQIKTASVIAALVLLLAGAIGIVYWKSSGTLDNGDNTQTTALPAALSSQKPADVRPAPAAQPVALAEYLPGGTIPILADPARKDDRNLGQTIEAELFDDSRGLQIVAPGISDWKTDSVARYDNVDFGPLARLDAVGHGMATHFAANIACPQDVGAHLEVRVDDPASTPICVLVVAANGGIGQRNAQMAPLSRPVSGRHTVYLSLPGGSGVVNVNLDWFKFVSLPRSAMQQIDAEQFDAMRGAVVTGAGVAHLDRGDFLRYSAVDFGQRPAAVDVSCGVRKQYAGHMIQFRIDKFDGPVIAELKVRDTGDFTQFETQRTAVKPVSGTHDLYLTFTGNGVANIEWFQFSKDGAPSTNPTTRNGGH